MDLITGRTRHWHMQKKQGNQPAFYVADTDLEHDVSGTQWGQHSDGARRLLSVVSPARQAAGRKAGAVDRRNPPTASHRSWGSSESTPPAPTPCKTGRARGWHRLSDQMQTCLVCHVESAIRTEKKGGGSNGRSDLTSALPAPGRRKTHPRRKKKAGWHVWPP